ncbi:MAG: FtsX-like permease family protein [Acidobacteria bacterium]|nr:FtsX-like permease family protein [Acidobacteriota bacterium]
MHERIAVEVEPDTAILLFTAAVTVITSLAFGLVPAWHVMRTAPALALAQRHGYYAPGWPRFTGPALVATQVALSLVLVTGAALLIDHVARLRHFNLGFQTDGVLLARLDPLRSGIKGEELAARYRQLLARLVAIAGVQSASISACTPIEGCGVSRFVAVPGFYERPEDRRYTALNIVAPRYLNTLGIPLLAGSDITPADAQRPRVAIVSSAMARHYFSGMDPIGRPVSIEKWTKDRAPYESIGVVGDWTQTELRGETPRALYMNMFQERSPYHQFSVRTSMDPAPVAAELRRAVRDTLPKVPVARMVTMNEQVDAAIVPERLMATLSKAFGVLGALLAGIGLYGLLAYTVARRTNEIGLRMALGATVADVRRLVLHAALGTVVAGLAGGLLLAWWLRPLVQRLIADLHVDKPWRGWPVLRVCVRWPRWRPKCPPGAP